jgi:hypothetical protein
MKTRSDVPGFLARRTPLKGLTTAARSALIVVLLAALSAAVLATTKGPDGGGYSATDEVIYSFADISGSGGGASILAGTDDATAVLGLPFPFRFYGTPYSLACVSSNGALYFITDPTQCSGLEADFANVDITAAAVPQDRPAMLPFWTDLTFQVAGGGSVFYQTVGAAPARRFIVQWHNAYPQGSASPVTFQAVLSEQGDRILYQYRSVSLASSDPARNGGRATVGIRTTESPGNNKQLAWSFNAPVLNNDTAIAFSAAAGDTAGPAIAASAPATIWPANNKTVPVRVTGTISDPSGVDPASARFAVTDEYGAVQPSGAIALGANGAFTVDVPLLAARNGNDRDGRRYTIVISARDVAGNESSFSVVVVVPHDQR